MAENHLQYEFSEQNQSARAIFEPYLQPDETLIWAERADPGRLATYYIRKPFWYGVALFAFVFVFFQMISLTDHPGYLTLGFTIAILIGALFMGSCMFIWEMILRQGWRALWKDKHFYAMTDRRLLRSIGGGIPSAYNRDKISGVRVEGPEDEEALGDIQFYWYSGQDHQTYFRFHGIKRARKVVELINAHIPMNNWRT